MLLHPLFIIAQTETHISDEDDKNSTDVLLIIVSQLLNNTKNSFTLYVNLLFNRSISIVVLKKYAAFVYIRKIEH